MIAVSKLILLEITMQQLAQLNVARMKYAFDDPKMQEFIDRLDDINALADHAPGFLWRLRLEHQPFQHCRRLKRRPFYGLRMFNRGESSHEKE